MTLNQIRLFVQINKAFHNGDIDGYKIDLSPVKSVWGKTFRMTFSTEGILSEMEPLII